MVNIEKRNKNSIPYFSKKNQDLPADKEGANIDQPSTTDSCWGLQSAGGRRHWRKINSASLLGLGVFISSFTLPSRTKTHPLSQSADATRELSCCKASRGDIHAAMIVMGIKAATALTVIGKVLSSSLVEGDGGIMKNQPTFARTIKLGAWSGRFVMRKLHRLVSPWLLKCNTWRVSEGEGGTGVTEPRKIDNCPELVRG